MMPVRHGWLCFALSGRGSSGLIALLARIGLILILHHEGVWLRATQVHIIICSPPFGAVLPSPDLLTEESCVSAALSLSLSRPSPEVWAAGSTAPPGSIV